MLFETVASILLMNLDKSKGYLSLMFQLLFKKIVSFWGVIELVGTRPRSKNATISYWSHVLCPHTLHYCGDSYVSVCIIILQIKRHHVALLFEFVTLMVAKLLYWWFIHSFIHFYLPYIYKILQFKVAIMRLKKTKWGRDLKETTRLIMSQVSSNLKLSFFLHQRLKSYYIGGLTFCCITG